MFQYRSPKGACLVTHIARGAIYLDDGYGTQEEKHHPDAKVALEDGLPFEKYGWKFHTYLIIMILQGANQSFELFTSVLHIFE